MRTLTTLMVSALGLAAFPHPSSGQEILVGGMVGRVESRQLRSRDEDSTIRTGVTFGAFVDAGTPAPWFSVLGEATYVQRGGRFDLEGFGPGDVEGDYITATLAPTVGWEVGPVGVLVYGGPTLELSVRSRAAAALAGAYANPSGEIFAVTAGGGLSFRIGSWVIRAEARIVEGLSAAYTGDAGDFRHRSNEILLRVGRLR